MEEHPSSGQAGYPHTLGVGRQPGSRRGTPRPSNMSHSSDALRDVDEDALDEIRRYESFTTVDWITDSMRERTRASRLNAHAAQRSSTSSNDHLANGSATRIYDMQSWGKRAEDRPPRWWPMQRPWGRRAWWFWRFLCGAAAAVTDSGVVILVGLLIGLNMAIISIATEWTSDLKQGYCSAGWWLNKKFCCGEATDSGPGGALPVAAIKASTAAALAAAKAAATANATTTTAPLPAFTTAARISTRAIGDALARAAESTSVAAPTPVNSCPDWIPWSSWTLPAYIIYLVFAIAFSSSCAYLVRVFAPYAAGSGISEIKCILAGFIINGFLGVGTLAIKSIGLPLAIASGLSIGKEGPAVHIACSIGDIVGNLFQSFARSQVRMRELLTAASAAGVAVAFGSPIGGVLFSLEEMAHNFPSSTMWRSFLCALAATVALSFMNPFRTGKLVLFQVSYDRDWHYFEILFYVIIGIFGGFYGAFIIRYNLQVQKFRRENLAGHGVAEATTLAAITALIGYWNMFLRIDMTESLEILFRECEGGGDYDNLCQSSAQWGMVNSLLLATVLRIVLVILSYGCKVPAGIFVPSMAIGATFGRMIGILVKALYNAYPHAAFFSACQPDVPCITPGTYAFLGAAAALAGVTRITVAVVVIMFELTGALTYILPTMLVVMITKGIADWYGKGGISEQTIKFQGYPFLDKDDHVFNLSVGDVMTRDAVVLFARGMELQEIEKHLASGSYKGFPLVQDQKDKTLLGYVGKTELRYAIGKARRARSSLSPRTMCVFSKEDGDRAHDWNHSNEHEPRMDGGTGENQTLLSVDDDADNDAADGLHSDEDHVLGATSGGVNMEGAEDIIYLGRWVEQNPLQVQPTMPLEVVMDLFKKMGPRVILVTRFGQCQGLVTVKDLLKVIASQERAELLAHSRNVSTPFTPLPTSTSMPRLASTGMWRMSSNAGAAGHENVLGDFGGELEILLKEALDWFKRHTDHLASRFLTTRGAEAAASISLQPRPVPSSSSLAEGSSSSSSYATVRGSQDRARTGGNAETSHFIVDDEEDNEDGLATPTMSQHPLMEHTP